MFCLYLKKTDMDALVEKLSTHRTGAITRAEEVYKERVKALGAQAEELSVTSAQLKAAVDIATQALAHSTPCKQLVCAIGFVCVVDVGFCARRCVCQGSVSLYARMDVCLAPPAALDVARAYQCVRSVSQLVPEGGCPPEIDTATFRIKYELEPLFGALRSLTITVPVGALLL